MRKSEKTSRLFAASCRQKIADCRKTLPERTGMQSKVRDKAYVCATGRGVEEDLNVEVARWSLPLGSLDSTAYKGRVNLLIKTIGIQNRHL